MKYWWLSESARLAAEKSSVEALANGEDWFEIQQWCFHQQMLCVEGLLIVHGHQYPVRLLYPDQFPEVPAWVEPQDEARWSGHQYGKGMLCLELRPDNWNANATGVDVLRSAYNLLFIENPLGEGKERAISAHNVGELQAYTWGENPVLLSVGCLSRILDKTAISLNALRWMADDSIWPIMIHDEIDLMAMQRPPKSDFYSWRADVPVYISESALSATTVLDRAELISIAEFDPLTAALVESSSSGVVIFRGNNKVEAYHLYTDGNIYHRRLFVLPDELGMRSSRSNEAKARQVTIVGGGSVGSKIAETLLRSGIHHMTLVDGDVMLPGNLERHTLDWRDIGFRKVHALKRRLLNIVPGADITVVDVNLNWQRSAKTHARQIESIAEGHVIVDATGDPSTALFLGAVAEANQRVFVSVEVFEGGIGALVATCVPPRDPLYVDARATFLAWCDEQGITPPQPGPRQYEMLTAEGVPVVADDAAVTMTAGHAARVILDILDGNPPGLDESWLLMGYRKSWLFEGHGHAIRLNVGERRDRYLAVDDPDVIEFALKLFKESNSEISADQ